MAVCVKLINFLLYNVWITLNIQKINLAQMANFAQTAIALILMNIFLQNYT